jgi:hypothetical protein
MGNPWTPGLPFAMQPWNKGTQGAMPSDASLPIIPRLGDDKAFQRMKNAKDTLDLPTSPKDMKRIQAIERAKNAKQ